MPDRTVAFLDGNGSAFPPEGIYYDKPRNGFERAQRASFDSASRVEWQERSRKV